MLVRSDIMVELMIGLTYQDAEYIRCALKYCYDNWATIPHLNGKYNIGNEVLRKIDAELDQSMTLE